MSGDGMKTRKYRALAVASAATGIFLCDGISYADMQEICSWVMGYSIWTHELASKPMVHAIYDEIHRQFPLMPTREEAREDWQKAAKTVMKAYPAKIAVAQGHAVRSASPVETLTGIMDQQP